jgi:hypothetical protein
VWRPACDLQTAVGLYKMTVSMPLRLAMLILVLGAGAARAQSQTETNRATSEETEPRIIGTTGNTMIGAAGYLDRISSSEDTFPINYALHVDVSRFIASRIALRGGIVGSVSAGGEDDLPSGSGVPALHALIGGLYYFTPRSMGSLYVGAEYWAQLTQRAARDAGFAFGTVGLQGLVSSRASVFIEGGYGVGLTRGDQGELRSRIVGRAGVRLKF